MISAFEVYLVMQMDNISVTIFVFALAGLIGGTISLIPVLASTEVNYLYDNPKAIEQKVADRAAWLPWSKRAIFTGILLFILAGLCPSSKTLAAMMIVPALTSDQVVEPLTAEGRELYALAKRALTNYVDQAPAPKPEPEADSDKQE